MSDFIIEPRGDLGFAVASIGVYPRHSVLAGQTRKSVIEFFDTVEEAREAFPDAQVLEGCFDPGNTVSHLPGEDDPVPGGMYPDDWDW